MNSGQVEGALRRLASEDREILALRHIVRWSNSQVAESLQIDTGTASSRYLKALRHLKAEIASAKPAFQPFLATTVGTNLAANSGFIGSHLEDFSAT